MVAGGSSALDGIRVIDAAHVIAGPGIATRLSDFGADVIKIEHPRTGDTTRNLGWSAGSDSLWWKHLGRNKRSVTVDLSHPQGQEIFLKLAAEADVVIESFRPGTLERWNLGPEQLFEVRPNLVLARVSGFGQFGPSASKPGFGTIAEALSSFVHMSGFPDQPPVLPPIALADEISALLGAFGVMVALHGRDLITGPGQVIDISLTESLLQFLGPLPLAHDVLDVNPDRTGNKLPYAAPRGTYQTKDNRWIALSGTSQSVAIRILHAIGGEELASDPRFATNDARLENIDELDRLIDAWMATHTRDEVLDQFEALQVAAAPIYDIREVFADEHNKARETFSAIDDADLGTVRTVAPQPRLSEMPAKIRFLGRPLGADTTSVLQEHGYDESEIERFRAAGAI